MKAIKKASLFILLFIGIILAAMGLYRLLTIIKANQKIKDLSFAGSFSEDDPRAFYLQHRPMKDLDLRMMSSTNQFSIYAKADPVYTILPIDVIYYEEKEGEKIPVLTLTKGTEIQLFPESPRLLYGLYSFPTYEAEWRYSIPFLEKNSDQSVSTTDPLFVRYSTLEEIFAYFFFENSITSFLNDLKTKYSLHPSGQYYYLLFPKRFVHDSLLSIDHYLWKTGSYTSPGLFINPWSVSAAGILFLGILFIIVSVIPFILKQRNKWATDSRKKRKGISIAVISFGGLILICAAILIMLLSPSVRVELRHGLDAIIIAHVPVEENDFDFYVYEKQNTIGISCWNRRYMEWMDADFVPAQSTDGISSYARLTVSANSGRVFPLYDSVSFDAEGYCMVYAKLTDDASPPSELQTDKTVASSFTVSATKQFCHIIVAQSIQPIPAIGPLFQK